MNENRETGNGMSATQATGWLRDHSSRIMTAGVILALLTVGPILRFTNETSRLTGIHQSAQVPLASAHDVERSPPGAAPWVAVLPPPEFESHPLLLVWKLLSTVWHPIQFAGIVLLVLIFVLLEYESLRDRFIRAAGATDIRSATLALNDAGDRLSRYFVSQFAVNLAFGLAIWMSLGLLHLPQALLCGILAGVMRFVPYVGVAIAALFAAVLALAVDPGWSLALSGLGVFILLDIVVGQLVEPHLYGHATGLSPLSVVVGAIFWSWLWGPAGLILSTPITVCLLVAGRHMKGLGVLELLLGNSTPLTLPQKFHQQGALSGDPDEIIADAQVS
jgi:predicted PurR-regulated permease PerM